MLRVSCRVFYHPKVSFSSKPYYDVIVIGGGHAGTEAAWAASNMSATTLLLSQKLSTIGEMSCNPSFGGIGKGHLLREIDALDGICPRICDISGMQYKYLNRRKGPAVWGPRAQIDRKLYKTNLQRAIFNKPYLHVKAASVEDLIVEKSKDGEKYICKGVITSDGQKIESSSVIITTGTFLRGMILLGLERFPAGRMGDKPSIGLAQTLEKLGLKMGRLKTGTPPRLDLKTIDFSRLEYTLGDDPPNPFSFLNKKVWLSASDQVKTYLTYTSPETAKVVQDNIHLSRHIHEEITGVRYCPSIEAKVLKYPENSHQIWLEQEGFDCDIVYPNGLAQGFPFDVQAKVINSIPGLEKTRLTRPGYSIQYDHIDPRQLKPSLELYKVSGLFLAGQINGTTGYEEAASQGIIAGINAASKAQSKEPFIVSRTTGYLGVLIDDLTTLGVIEPYRMFTARAEFRLFMRPDNADLRLTEQGYKQGCVSQKRYEIFSETKAEIERCKELLKSIKRKSKEWTELLADNILFAFRGNTKSAYDIMRTPGVSDHLFELLRKEGIQITEDEIILQRVKIEAQYEKLLDKEKSQIEEVKKEEQLIIPEDFNYSDSRLSLPNEAREILSKHRPASIASASRIPGVRYAAVTALVYYLQKYVATDKNV
ncbi:protein MTO1 homolog, mitochondrial-like [Tetranychus urticae]|uniref:protein MTO1 homolog, mitochondrial-like n=1 Tax=Tetranychus urticae TaxID=32264 RepID=UPI00077B909A|nr:protein MTO1 homolog, mitochondrial-like [Tetranychus urticae]